MLEYPSSYDQAAIEQTNAYLRILDANPQTKVMLERFQSFARENKFDGAAIKQGTVALYIRKLAAKQTLEIILQQQSAEIQHKQIQLTLTTARDNPHLLEKEPATLVNEALNFMERSYGIPLEHTSVIRAHLHGPGIGSAISDTLALADQCGALCSSRSVDRLMTSVAGDPSAIRGTVDPYHSAFAETMLMATAIERLKGSIDEKVIKSALRSLPYPEAAERMCDYILKTGHLAGLFDEYDQICQQKRQSRGLRQKSTAEQGLVALLVDPAVVGATIAPSEATQSLPSAAVRDTTDMMGGLSLVSPPSGASGTTQIADPSTLSFAACTGTAEGQKVPTMSRKLWSDVVKLTPKNNMALAFCAQALQENSASLAQPAPARRIQRTSSMLNVRVDSRRTPVPSLTGGRLSTNHSAAPLQVQPASGSVMHSRAQPQRERPQGGGWLRRQTSSLVNRANNVLSYLGWREKNPSSQDAPGQLRRTQSSTHLNRPMWFQPLLPSVPVRVPPPNSIIEEEEGSEAEESEVDQASTSNAAAAVDHPVRSEKKKHSAKKQNKKLKNKAPQKGDDDLDAIVAEIKKERESEEKETLRKQVEKYKADIVKHAAELETPSQSLSGPNPWPSFVGYMHTLDSSGQLLALVPAGKLKDYCDSLIKGLALLEGEFGLQYTGSDLSKRATNQEILDYLSARSQFVSTLGEIKSVYLGEREEKGYGGEYMEMLGLLKDTITSTWKIKKQELFWQKLGTTKLSDEQIAAIEEAIWKDAADFFNCDPYNPNDSFNPGVPRLLFKQFNADTPAAQKRKAMWSSSMLYIASAHRNESLIKMLLAEGVDPNELDPEFKLPLVWRPATVERELNSEIVRVFLENKKTKTTFEVDGKTTSLLLHFMEDAVEDTGHDEYYSPEEKEEKYKIVSLLVKDKRTTSAQLKSASEIAERLSEGDGVKCAFYQACIDLARDPKEKRTIPSPPCSSFDTVAVSDTAAMAAPIYPTADETRNRFRETLAKIEAFQQEQAEQRSVAPLPLSVVGGSMACITATLAAYENAQRMPTATVATEKEREEEGREKKQKLYNG